MWFYNYTSWNPLIHKWIRKVDLIFLCLWYVCKPIKYNLHTFIKAILKSLVILAI